MQKIKLFTRDAHFVSEVSIPPFSKLPEVIFWGSRTFVFDKRSERYLEGFAVFAFADGGLVPAPRSEATYHTASGTAFCPADPPVKFSVVELPAAIAAKFLARLATDRGSIVSSSDCSTFEIAQARACGRFYVDENSLGYVLRPKPSESPIVSIDAMSARLLEIARMVCWRLAIALPESEIQGGDPCKCYSCSSRRTLVEVYGETRVATMLAEASA